MKSNIDCYIGSQIKFYRNLINMSLTELADSINKSKSTVSKYENGMVSVDIETLYKISDVLNTDIINIIDYSHSIKKKNFITSNSFENSEKLYLYHYYEQNYYISIINLRHTDNNNINSTLYYKVGDIKNINSCSCIYRGYMNSYQNNINFVLQNYYSKSEEILLNFFVPLGNVSNIIGMMIGLQEKTLKPACVKVVLSKKLLSDEYIKEMLKISQYTIDRLEKDGILIVE